MNKKQITVGSSCRIPKSGAERQQRLREKREKAGLIRKEYWATKQGHILLAKTEALLAKTEVDLENYFKSR